MPISSHFHRACLRTSSRAVAVMAALCLSLTAVHAADYTENEPNNNFPPAFLPGNPLFVSGDRLLGSADDVDTDDHYITFAGPGAPGLYRYTFDLAITAGDSFLDIYDASPNGAFLGRSDDFPDTVPASRVIFDQFHTNTSNTIFGVGLGGFTDPFDYTMTVTRTATPVIALGLLGLGTTSQTNPTPAGAGTWYSFTITGTALVTLDTFGSQNDDTEIALFDAAGNTIGGNDDAIGLLSEIEIALTGGTYFVAVGPFNSRYNWDLGTNSQLGWDRNGFSGGGDAFTDGNNLLPHTLNVAVAAVPEPTSCSLLALTGLLVGGCPLVRRRRAASAR